MACLLLVGSYLGSVPKHSGKLTVAVASSLKVPLEEVTAAFEDQYEIDVELISASSGVLATQILHGAPYDLFLSADLQYPQKVFEQGKTFFEPQIFTLGSLVFWSNTPLLGKSAEDILQKNQQQNIAIANPKFAPFGKAAKQWLKENELYQHVQERLVFGENVTQVNQFIFSDQVSAAFSSSSAIDMTQLREKGHWKVLPLKIPHGAVIIQQEDNQDRQIHRAELFMDYLFGKRAQCVFQQFGYKNPPKKY
ncbi:molybdate-binding protein ModA [Fodinibius salicampi]